MSVILSWRVLLKPVDMIDVEIAVAGVPVCRMLEVCRPSAMELVVES